VHVALEPACSVQVGRNNADDLSWLRGSHTLDHLLVGGAMLDTAAAAPAIGFCEQLKVNTLFGCPGTESASLAVGAFDFAAVVGIDAGLAGVGEEERQC
jgi:hypothetical protein